MNENIIKVDTDKKNMYENYITSLTIKDLLIYESQYKLLTIILIIVLTFIIYMLISILTKAFKMSDIKLKY